MLATTPLVHAQTVPSAEVCSEQARLGLRDIGPWAEAPYASDQVLAFGAGVPERCTVQEREGLPRVGGWAELQCEVDD